MGKRRLYRRGAVVILISLATGCVTAPVQPLTATGHAYAESDDEKKLIQRAGELDDEFNRKGLLLSDAEVNAYVRSVADRLIPPQAAGAVVFRVHVLRDPVVNAFALANGSIYLNAGLLARLENEAQLAHVLSHEIAHVVQRHGLQRQRNRTATVVTAHIADLALFGTSIAYLPAIGALAGHSRENEIEADRLALDYMAQTGYSLQGAEQMFKLLQEVKYKESLWGSVYSSHPDNQQRAQYTREILDSGKLAPSSAAAVTVRDYTGLRDRLILETVRLKLNVRQYELATEYVDKALARNPRSAWLHYYRGEAHRLMAEDPAGAAREYAWIYDKTYSDELVEQYRHKKSSLLDAAKQAYRQSLSVDKKFAYAHRGLGLVAYAEGEAKAAQEALRYYLANATEVNDRRYIDNIIGRLDNK